VLVLAVLLQSCKDATGFLFQLTDTKSVPEMVKSNKFFALVFLTLLALIIILGFINYFMLENDTASESITQKIIKKIIQLFSIILIFGTIFFIVYKIITPK
jgi:hypothetical protein